MDHDETCHFPTHVWCPPDMFQGWSWSWCFFETGKWLWSCAMYQPRGLGRLDVVGCSLHEAITRKSIASRNQRSSSFPVLTFSRLTASIVRTFPYCYVSRSAFVIAVWDHTSKVSNYLYYKGIARRMAESSQNFRILLRPRLPIDVIEFRIFKILPVVLMFLLTAILPPFPKNLHLLGIFVASLITPLTSQLLLSSSTILIYLLMLHYIRPESILSKLPLMWVTFQV